MTQKAQVDRLPVIGHEKAKQKSAFRKDGQPRQKPGPKPKAKQLPVQRLGPSVRWIEASAAAAAKPMSIVDAPLWPGPGSGGAISIEEAMQICNQAYGDVAAMMLKSYGLNDGELPNSDQAKQMERLAAIAYRCALPSLKPNQVQAYIACVAQGVSLDVFTGRQGSQLLYAAQVCASSVRNSNKAS